MHESEERELVACAVCGAALSFVSDRAFGFGTDSALCWECSVKRGGRYDAVHERWEVVPRTDDLRDEDA
jgi:hypothetical protein